MKHDWKRDEDGEIRLGETDHPIAWCRICGLSSACVWCEPGTLDKGTCEGVDLTIVVDFAIHHPGRAVEDDDSQVIRHKVEIPLRREFGGPADKPEPVEAALAEALEAVARQWRECQPGYLNGWALALAVEERRR